MLNIDKVYFIHAVVGLLCLIPDFSDLNLGGRMGWTVPRIHRYYLELKMKFTELWGSPKRYFLTVQNMVGKPGYHRLERGGGLRGYCKYRLSDLVIKILFKVLLHYAFKAYNKTIKPHEQGCCKLIEYCYSNKLNKHKPVLCSVNNVEIIIKEYFLFKSDNQQKQIAYSYINTYCIFDA